MASATGFLILQSSYFYVTTAFAACVTMGYATVCLTLTQAIMVFRQKDKERVFLSQIVFGYRWVSYYFDE